MQKSKTGRNREAQTVTKREREKEKREGVRVGYKRIIEKVKNERERGGEIKDKVKVNKSDRKERRDERIKWKDG